MWQCLVMYDVFNIVCEWDRFHMFVGLGLILNNVPEGPSYRHTCTYTAQMAHGPQGISPLSACSHQPEGLFWSEDKYSVVYNSFVRVYIRVCVCVCVQGCVCVCVGVCVCLWAFCHALLQNVISLRLGAANKHYWILFYTDMMGI